MSQDFNHEAHEQVNQLREPHRDALDRDCARPLDGGTRVRESQVDEMHVLGVSQRGAPVTTRDQPPHRASLSGLSALGVPASCVHA